MVGLLFVFILMMTLFIYQVRDDLNQRTNESEAAEHRKVILDELQKFLRENNITQVSIDEEHGILRLPEGVLFDSGEADIKPGTDANRVARVLSRAFYEVLDCSVFARLEIPFNASQECLSRNENRIFVEAIFVEGHTDNVPIHSGGLSGYKNIDTNLKLSVFRAAHTYEIMVNESPRLVDFFSPSGYPIFASTGYGETRPLGDNLSKESRKRNRRIDIRILMHVPKSGKEFRQFQQRLQKDYTNKINETN